MRTAQTLQSCGDSERGYALVSLLALMSLLAMFALAVAPRVQQQTQREWEKEALFRGDQVGEAIRAYYRWNTQYRGTQGTNALPTSMDQLLEGVQIPGRTKRLQILRSSASRDPLSSDGEWRLIGPTSEDFRGLVQSLTLYSGGVPPVPRQEFTGLASLIPRMSNALDVESAGTARASENTSPDASGPFIGVASRSQRDSVITFFGIERHDEWIFTPMFR
jgi:type II secretory pathway pseudopilin PulG